MKSEEYNYISKNRTESNKPISLYNINDQNVKTKSISIDPIYFLSKEGILKKAFEFHNQGAISDAEKYYNYFLNMSFRDLRVFINYGLICKKTNRVDKAIDLFDEAGSMVKVWFIVTKTL